MTPKLRSPRPVDDFPNAAGCIAIAIVALLVVGTASFLSLAVIAWVVTR